MVEAKKMGLVGLVGLGVAGLVGGSGCNEAYTDLAKSSFVYHGAGAVAKEGVRGIMRDKKKEWKSGVVAGQGGEGNINRKNDNRILISRWNDYNFNKADEPDEILGDIGNEKVNLSNVGLRIAVDYYSGTNIPITYTFLDFNDNVLHTLTCSNRAVLVGKGEFSEGKYTVVAMHGNDTESRVFNVVR